MPTPVYPQEKNTWYILKRRLLAGLAVSEKKYIYCPYWRSNPGSSNPYPRYYTDRTAEQHAKMADNRPRVSHTTTPYCFPLYSCVSQTD